MINSQQALQAIAIARQAAGADPRLAFHLSGTDTHPCPIVLGCYLSTDLGFEPASLDSDPNTLSTRPLDYSIGEWH